MANTNRQAKVLFTAETKDFTSAIKKAQSALSTLKSELKLNEASFKNSGDAVKYYQEKQRLLQAELDQNKNKIENLRQKLEVAKRVYGEGSEEVQRWQRQLNSSLTEQQRIEHSLNECEHELQQYTREQQQASTALGKLNSTINKQEHELEQLKREYVNACLQFGRNSTEARELGNQIDSLSRDLNENRREVQRYEDAADELDNTMEDVEDEAKDMGDGFTVLKGVIVNLVTDALRKLTEGLKEVSKYVLTAGMDFDAGMSKVKALSGSSAQDMEKLRKKAKEMGATTQFSASESAEAFSYMAMAGWKANDMIDGIKGVMDLAAASGEDLATTSDIVTDALTAFGLKAKDSSHFANILATVSTAANTNVGLLGESFKYCAPVCGSLGYKAEDAAVALGIMANAGIKGSQAGTTLKNAIVNMAKPTDAMKKAMDQLGISMTDGTGKSYSLKEMLEQLREKIGGVDVELVDSQGNMRDTDAILGDLKKSHADLSTVQKVQAAATIFGKESLAGMLAVINESPENYANLTDAIHKCDDAHGGLGSAAGTAETMLDNLKGDITRLKSQMEGLAIDAFEKFAEPLRGAVKQVSDAFNRNEIKSALNAIAEKFGEVAAKVVSNIPEMVDGLIKFGKWVIDNKEKIKILGIAIATAFSISKVAGFVSTLATLLNPVTLIAIGIAALVAGFWYLWDTCEDFRGFWMKLWDGLKKVLSPIVDILKGSLSKAFSTLKSTINPLKDAFNMIVKSLSPLKQYFAEIAKVIGGVLVVAIGVVIGIITGLADALSGVITVVQGVLQFIASGFAMYFETMGAIFQTIKALFTGNFDKISEIWKNWGNNMKEYLGTLWEGVKNIFKGAFDAIISFVVGFIRGIVTFFVELYDTIVGHSIVPDLMNKIIEIFMWLPNKVVAIVKSFVSGAIDVFNSLKTKATSIFNSIKSFLSSIWSSIKSVVSSVISSIVSFVVSRFNNIKSNISSILNSVKSVISTVWNGIKSAVSTVISAIVSFVVSRFNNIKSNISSILNAVKSVVSSIWNGIKSVVSSVVSSVHSVVSSKFNGIKSTISSVLNSAKSTVISVFNGIKSTINNVMNTASNIVKSGVNKIKSFFNFKVSLPKVKLPHFSVTGSKNPVDWLDKGVPRFSVQWYAKGGIFKKPTLFNTLSGIKGVGEAGAEAVLPIDTLQDFIANALEKYLNNDALIYAIDKLANREIVTNMYINDRQFATATATANDYVDANRINLSGRGVTI